MLNIKYVELPLAEILRVLDTVRVSPAERPYLKKLRENLSHNTEGKVSAAGLSVAMAYALKDLRRAQIPHGINAQGAIQRALVDQQGPEFQTFVVELTKFTDQFRKGR